MSDGKEFSVYFEFYDLEKFPKTDWMILYQDPDKYRTRIELAQPRKIQQSQSTINSGFSVQYCASEAFAVPTPKTVIMSTAQKATTINFLFLSKEVPPHCPSDKTNGLQDSLDSEDYHGAAKDHH